MTRKERKERAAKRREELGTEMIEYLQKILAGNEDAKKKGELFYKCVYAMERRNPQEADMVRKAFFQVREELQKMVSKAMIELEIDKALEKEMA